jgi:hypothetical protein
MERGVFEMGIGGIGPRRRSDGRWFDGLGLPNEYY